MFWYFIVCLKKCPCDVRGLSNITKFLLYFVNKIIMTDQNKQQLKHVVSCIKSEGRWTNSKFSDCVVDMLAEGEKFVEVICCLNGDQLMITPVNDSKSLNTSDNNLTPCQKFGPLLLEHSLICPLKEVKKGDYSEVSFPENRVHVAIAVAVILESSDSHILLTKRASTMRSYPGIWVPPGGHLDTGETLLQCGLRELEEETGLKLEQSDIKTNYLCMWEAVAPPMLTMGSPRSHSVVVYMHVQMPYSWEEMQPKINVNQDEVQAWCWYTRNTILQLQSTVEGMVPIYRPGELSGKYEQEEVKLSTMFRTPYLWSQGMFYSGTHQALVLWSKKSSKL